MNFILPRDPPSCIPQLEKIYGKPLSGPVYEMAKEYDRFLAATREERNWIINIPAAVKEVEIAGTVTVAGQPAVCDCGAVKANTTHAGWCSTAAA